MGGAESLSIEVVNACVTYTGYSEKGGSLRDRLALRRAREISTVRAVQDVSFNVHRGEIVGLIGSNGSGKSSLLSAIAGLQPVSSGSIRVRGEPALLGVGAVLSGQLSGKRNVLLGCMALGMTRAEAIAALPEVVRFSGLPDAMGRPMRTYSSGMRSRLHFAIATSVKPDVLLVDEVLAVGDRDFRRKSVERIRSLRESAKVVVLVTHSLKQVVRVCTRAIWLEQGRLLADGAPREVVQSYVDSTGGGDDDE